MDTTQETMAVMGPQAYARHLKNQLDNSIARESAHALAASSLDELVTYVMFRLQAIGGLDSCGPVTKRNVAKLREHMRLAMERIAEGHEYHPPSR